MCILMGNHLLSGPNQMYQKAIYKPWYFPDTLNNQEKNMKMQDVTPKVPWDSFSSRQLE